MGAVQQAMFNGEHKERFPTPKEFFLLIVTLPSPGIPPFDIHSFGRKAQTFQNYAPPNSTFCEIQKKMVL